MLVKLCFITCRTKYTAAFEFTASYPGTYLTVRVWGMHTPRAAAANDVCAALQCLYDYFLRTICQILTPSTPGTLLLAGLGLLPLQVFVWHKLCRFRLVWLTFLLVPSTLSVWTTLPMFTNCNMASSLAACLHSVGFEMPYAHDVVPCWTWTAFVKAVTARLQSTAFDSLYCPWVYLVHI